MSGSQTQTPTAEWRVLLAHGDPSKFNHLRTLLNDLGYSVVPAQNGAQARSLLLAADTPGLAIVDWDLTGTSGIELCRELQRAPQRCLHYVLLLTPANGPNHRVCGLESGAEDCLPQPVDARELDFLLQRGSRTLCQRRLHESENHFRGAFENAGLGMALVRLNGNFLRVNRALCQYLGYSEEELCRMNLCAITLRDSNVSCDASLERCRDKGNHRMEFERRFITKDGRSTWGLLTISAILDADDRPSMFVIHIEDTNKRKLTEDALQRSEAFLRAMKGNATDLIMVLNENLRFVYANPAHLPALGYAPGDLRGRQCMELIHPEDRERVKEAVAYVRQHGGSRIVDVRMRHRDGSWRHVEGHGGLLRNTTGQVEGFALSARVINERLKAKQEVQAAQAETEVFLQSIPSVLIGLSSEGIITRWNRVAEQSLGLSAASVVGKPLRDCGVKWLHPDMDGEIQRWLQTKTIYLCDILPFERGGKRKILGLKIRRVEAASQNQQPWFIISGADVTERKYLEEQLRQAQKMEAIGQLAAGIAHEINTPTQYASDNVQFLKDSWPAFAKSIEAGTVLRSAATGAVPEPQLAAFDKAMQENDIGYLTEEVPHAIEQSIEGLQRVAKIVRAIKEFSHPGEEEKQPIDLNKAIETTVTVTRNEWKYVADVNLELDRSLPPVVCLSGEINQVMVNLIVNAAQAVAEGLGKDPTKKGCICIVTRQEDQWARISVQDSGKGIPAEIRARIFEPFFTTKPVGQGTGQGLALAHSVVVGRHQGQIWFDSEVGKGTTFHVRLPLKATVKQ